MQENKTKTKNEENSETKNNKTRKRHRILNCLFGSLMVLGCAGTITFGSLWCSIRKLSPTPTPTEMITVTFGDLKGGTIKGLTGNTISVLPTTTFGMLPTPTKDSYDFKGWKVNGDLKEADVQISTACTVEPEWIEHKDPIGQIIEIPYVESDNCFILNIPSGTTKGTHYALMMDTSKIPSASKAGNLQDVYLGVGTGEVGKINPLVLQHKAQFLVDNNLVPASSYSFINKFYGEEPNLLYQAGEGIPALPGFDKNTSKLYLDITIDEDTTNNVIIVGGIDFAS